jgi:glutamine synthetase
MFGYSLEKPWQNSAYLTDLFKHLEKSGIDLDCFHTETGPGVWEIPIKHSSALKLADNVQLTKYLIKSIAHCHGITASFMAKPWNDLPGCGGHIHLSIVDSAGKNVFAQDEEFLHHFMAGILQGLSDLTPLFAPTINSYKRLDLRFWAPAIIGWGEDNRLAAVRLVRPKDAPESTRIEIRVTGADANPYLALAAILKSGIYGVRCKVPLPGPLSSDEIVIPNTESILGAISRNGYQVLPDCLRLATERMVAEGSMARKIFSKEFVDHYGMTRLHEVKLFDGSVTEWERKRYFETT